MKSITIITVYIDLPPQGKLRSYLLIVFIGLIVNWLTLIWINYLYLIAYNNITINLESNKPGTCSNSIKIAWNYVFLPLLKNLKLSFTSFCYGRAVYWKPLFEDH